ncbi:hypothetical protein D8674_042137 [Pyrus ussuriensis x Pyrus communis]|uniref:Protein kinase domain-containing protein n=1 Tax=Pyrus ussuriensis x Pyrus communis TaxID=2448454 RepID=A0A5N5I6R3_9ROSA|nr:hypothetical protein D8674_042137 [Pyrus ussuriensis x Pyrus communis]
MSSSSSTSSPPRPPHLDNQFQAITCLVRRFLFHRVSVVDIEVRRCQSSSSTTTNSAAQSSRSQRRWIAGGFGYLDPDHCINFQLTDKIDVYSFGTILLELLTSQKDIDLNRGEEDMILVLYMKRVLKEERLMDIVDSVIKEGAGRLELQTMRHWDFSHNRT